MSQSIEIIKKENRTLSEDFNLSSPNTQSNILTYTNGVKPTSKLKLSPRLRFDSVELSPTTESVLLFHGLKIKKN